MEEEREQIRINKEVRSCGRVDDRRFKTVTDRGYDIVNGLSYDKHGTTILIGALKSAQWDVAQRIIGLGADVLRLDRRKITPLHALCLGAQDLEGAPPAQVEALAAELIAKV